jgi:hypothetical protein
MIRPQNDPTAATTDSANYEPPEKEQGKLMDLEDF